MTPIAARLAVHGFALVPAASIRADLAPHGTLADWQAFAASWDDLPEDQYMADGGRYRRRRHAVFTAAPGAPMLRAPHRPHYQSRDYNALNGGIPRLFEPVAPSTVETASFRTIAAYTRSLFDGLSPSTTWDIEMHQFRIEARAGASGQPTPEGMHRDGVDYVMVLLIRRENIEQGVTSIHALDGTLLGNFTLAAPLDAALVHDRRVFHGVTAVQPVNPQREAFRDVLVLTFKHTAETPQQP